MGTIQPDVEIAYFKSYPEHRNIVTPFLFEFDVNHAKQYRKYGTTISIFLIKPNKSLSLLFGFTDEILLVYSHYDRLEPRTIQAIEAAISEPPFSLRADPLLFFLVSNDREGEQWVEKYICDHPQFRTPIVFNEKELLKHGDKKEYVRSALFKSLFSRDIFDYQLPLDQDMYFFGRTKDLNNIMDAVRKSQNKGIFGLRKTGKTSLLFKVQRALRHSGIAQTVYLDCKNPVIRSIHWKELLNIICDEIISDKKTIFNENKENPGARLKDILKSLPDKEKICVIFDEIEYISPFAKRDTHWKSQFIDFWQTLWSIQSEIRKVSFIIAGVNPYVTEVDLFDGIQNPIFGIVQGLMLTGLDKESCSNMISRIGRQMGLQFEDGALTYLHSRYGGHPLLTRMACSYTNADVSANQIRRPAKISEKMVREKENERDGELAFYCRHITSELELFYPDEYYMLTMLARGDIVDFLELAAEPEWIRHLNGYGVLEFDNKSRPRIKIPALHRYIANEAARRDGTREPRKTVEKPARGQWIERRKRSIINEAKALLQLIHDKKALVPYGSPYLPEADRIESVKEVNSWSEFQSFITNINLCLVETIDNINGRAYFFGTFQAEFHSLFYALNRIRVYRNNADHLKLNQSVEAAFRQYIKVDLMERELSEYKEPWFVLQQIVLDELLVAIQTETNLLA